MCDRPLLGAPALVTLAMLVVPACDPQAKPAPGVARADVLGAGRTPSRERESCAATGDCEAPLRCVERVCRAPASSRLGEYRWVAGEVAAGKGDFAHSVEQFAQAGSAFEADRLEPPPGLLCAYGAALRRRPDDPKAAEQAARLLHRCLLGSAPGSAEHRAALAELAELESLGLDPALLARDKPADTYLTRPPRKPASLEVQVAQTTPARDKGYAAWIGGVVQSDEARRQLARCADDYWTATQRTRVQVALGVRYKGRYDEEEEIFLPGGTFELEPAGGGSEAEAAAGRCVKEVLAAQSVDYARKAAGGSWTGAVAVTLQSGP